MKRLYNGGQRINEKMRFHKPGPLGGGYGYWDVDAPEQQFFTVPSEINVDGARIVVEFATDLVSKYGDSGLVLVDRNLDAGEIAKQDKEAEDQGKDPTTNAASDEVAKKKGDAQFERFIKKIAQSHLEECEIIRSKGGTPRPAVGFKKYAMKRLGIADPGAVVMGVAEQKMDEVQELKKQMAEMAALIAAQGHKSEAEKPARK